MGNSILRVGGLGTGSIFNHAHVPAYVNLDSVELVAVYDPDRSAAERTRERWRSFEIIEEPVAALARARELAGPRDAICVTGSLFVISDLVEAEALRLPFAEA